MWTRPNAPGRHRALTVVEALVALTILSSAVIPIIIFLSTGSETVRGTRDTAGAVFVANRTFEELRGLPYDELVSAVKRINSSEVIKVGPLAYKRTVTLSPLSKGSALQGVLASLKVEWARDRRKTLAYEVSTIVSDVR